MPTPLAPSDASSFYHVARLAQRSLVVRRGFHVVAATLHDEHTAGELADDHSVLVPARRLHRHDAGAGPGRRLPLREHLALRVECVVREHRMSEPDIVPSEVRESPTSSWGSNIWH